MTKHRSTVLPQPSVSSGKIIQLSRKIHTHHGSDDGLDDNVHYLRNSGVEIDGVKFYGVPMLMDHSH